MRPVDVQDFDTFAAHFPRPSAAGFHARHPSDDWTDDTTPRTDKPVRFRVSLHRSNAWAGYPLTHDGIPIYTATYRA